MIRANKEKWREEISESLNRSSAVILTRYTGMTVEQLTNLRRDLKKHNAEFHVVKNNIIAKAVEGQREEALVKLLSGQVGVVYAFGDVAATAKAVEENAKTNEKFLVLGGFMDNALLSKADIKGLATLPSREVLMARIIGTFVAPHRNLLSVFNGVSRNLVQVLSAIKDQKAS